MIARYGWQADRPDFRDHRLALPEAGRHALPTSVDLMVGMPPVYDQGQLGSCTGNAIAGGVEFAAISQGEASATPSRLWIYYQARVIEGTVGQDSGAQIRDGMKVVANQGVPPESDWPYDIRTFASLPSALAKQDAPAHKAVEYLRVARRHLKGALARNFPVVFGFTVYESFEGRAIAQSGIMPMPAPTESVVGGHAVLAAGYNADYLLVRNSWGAKWGLGGYFKMPWAYALDSGLTSDFWTIRKVS